MSKRSVQGWLATVDLHFLQRLRRLEGLSTSSCLQDLRQTQLTGPVSGLQNGVKVMPELLSLCASDP